MRIRDFFYAFYLGFALNTIGGFTFRSWEIYAIGVPVLLMVAIINQKQ